MTDTTTDPETGDNRPSVYFDPDTLGGVWIYRASASGECVRALVASALEYDEARSADTRAMLKRTASEGDLHEEAMRNQLIAEGHVFSSVQDEVLVPIVKNKIYLRGHTDGVIVEGPRLREVGSKPVPAVFEAKSLSTNLWKKWMARGKDGQPKRFATDPRKAGQITVYMAAYPGHDSLYQSKRREDGSVDTFLIHHDSPPMAFRDIRNKVLIAESYRRQGFLPGCDIEGRWGCDFFYLHDEEVLPSDPVSEEVMGALGELAQRYVELRAVEKAGEEAAKERKGFTGEMVELVGDHPYVETGDFKVSVVRYEKAYTDWAKIQEEFTKGWDYIKDTYETPDGLVAAFTENRPVVYPKVTESKGK